MDLNAIDLFAKVVEYKSFTLASSKTGVPTSSISRKISELEANLNVSLLERTTRKLRVTEQGRIFYENIRPAVETLNLARINLMDKHTDGSGTLRLSVPPGIEQSVVIPLLAHFQRSSPAIKLKVVITASNLNFIEDGIDVALRIGELKDSSLIAIPLLRYPHIVVASQHYIQQNGIPKHPSELTQFNLISGMNWYDDSQWRFIQDSNQFALTLDESLSLNHYTAIQHAIEADMGIGEIPAINCVDAIKQGRLVQVLPDWKIVVYGQQTIKLSIVYTANRYNSVPITKFKDFCVDYFNSSSAASQ